MRKVLLACRWRKWYHGEPPNCSEFNFISTLPYVCRHRATLILLWMRPYFWPLDSHFAGKLLVYLACIGNFVSNGGHPLSANIEAQKSISGRFRNFSTVSPASAGSDWRALAVTYFWCVQVLSRWGSGTTPRGALPWRGRDPRLQSGSLSWSSASLRFSHCASGTAVPHWFFSLDATVNSACNKRKKPQMQMHHSEVVTSCEAPTSDTGTVSSRKVCPPHFCWFKYNS